MLAISGLPPERVHVVRNPVVTADLARQAAAAVAHPWLHDTAVPVVMGIGRLTRQKDFPTLIRAFARLRRIRPARLLILGEGADRQALLDLATTEGVAADVALPGFQANPYAWLVRARLTEALALGVPVVSTDCRSGPRELLAGGRYGPLVPVGEVEALATAMNDVLARPLSADELKSAVNEYGAERSARRYLEILGL